MYTKPSLMKTLQQFENALNHNESDPNIQYEAGYLNQSYAGAYFYINRIHQVDDMTGEGFLVTILQKNGDTETFDVLNKTQMQIIRKFKNKLYRELRIGQNAKLRNYQIKIHIDYDESNDKTIKHP